MAKLRDKVKMPAPKMDEEEELDVLELGEEESEMLPDEEDAEVSPLAEFSDEELMDEVEARGLGVEGLEKRDAEVEVPGEEDDELLGL
jgi:hypothetical protein